MPRFIFSAFCLGNRDYCKMSKNVIPGESINLDCPVKPGNDRSGISRQSLMRKSAEAITEALFFLLCSLPKTGLKIAPGGGPDFYFSNRGFILRDS